MKTLTKEEFILNPSEILIQILVDRKSKNRAYSASALARDLGLSQAFFSQVLNGKRKLSFEQRLRISDQLKLRASSRKQNTRTIAKIDSLQHTLEQEKILKQWYHFAILELSQTRQLKNDSSLIAKLLGISEFEARSAVKRLLSFGYLALSDDLIVKTKLPFIIHSKSSSRALRELHVSRLQRAGEELARFTEADVEARHFQTLFLPSSREKILLAKRMMNDFQNKLISVLTDEASDEVFQFSAQYFSIQPKQN